MNNLKASLFNTAASLFSLSAKPLFIIGHGRSGTTWVGKTISRVPNVLYYNEPCWPGKIGHEKQYAIYLRYFNKNSSDDFFQQQLDLAFEGKAMPNVASWIYNKPMMRFDSNARVVIKEVASVMCVDWVKERYQPDFLFLFRNPCAVCLSEQEREVDHVLSKRLILENEALFRDHLAQYRSTMERANSPLEVYAMIWGARNRVLCNLIAHEQNPSVVLYEELSANPLASYQALFGKLHLAWTEELANHIQQTTTQHADGAYATTKVSSEQTNRWRNKLSNEQTKAIREFVLPFELPYYNTNQDFESWM